MKQALKTLKQAQAYVAWVREATGKTHLVFRVPKGSLAYRIGWRFGTCEDFERADYERDGAVFVD